SDPAYITPALQAEFLSYDCANPPSNPAQAPADQPMITCDVSGQAKYILGPVELDGNDISDATNGQEQNTGQWAVNLVFNDQGTQKFADVSQRLYGAQAPFNQFAFVLDGSVLSAPSMNGIIVDAAAHHGQLHPGVVQGARRPAEVRRAAAELHRRQLRHRLGNPRIAAAAGRFIAGLIGLGLVAIYSLIVYRALGTVIIASLGVMAVLTYLALCILAWR
ncbi:preprotein translocase subunit SecD, partial [Microbacterium sp. SUBG005]